MSPNFIKNPKYDIQVSPSGGNRLFHADRQRDGHDKANSRYAILRKRQWTLYGTRKTRSVYTKPFHFWWWLYSELTLWQDID